MIDRNVYNTCVSVLKGKIYEHSLTYTGLVKWQMTLIAQLTICFDPREFYWGNKVDTSTSSSDTCL